MFFFFCKIVELWEFLFGDLRVVYYDYSIGCDWLDVVEVDKMGMDIVKNEVKNVSIG